MINNILKGCHLLYTTLPKLRLHQSTISLDIFYDDFKIETSSSVLFFSPWNENNINTSNVLMLSEGDHHFSSN